MWKANLGLILGATVALTGAALQNLSLLIGLLIGLAIRELMI